MKLKSKKDNYWKSLCNDKNVFIREQRSQINLLQSKLNFTFIQLQLLLNDLKKEVTICVDEDDLRDFVVDEDVIKKVTNLIIKE